jgi:hypothetical protein
VSDDRAPIFGRWRVWYAIVIANLIAVILLCAVLAGMNG